MHVMALTAALLAGGASSAFGGERTYGKHRSEHRRRMNNRIADARKVGSALALGGLPAPVFGPEFKSVAEFNARLQGWRAVREIPAR